MYWNYEKEWRIVCYLKDEFREMFFKYVIVSGIYIGYKVCDNNKGVFNFFVNMMEDRYLLVLIYVVYFYLNDLRLEFEEIKNGGVSFEIFDLKINDWKIEKIIYDIVN